MLFIDISRMFHCSGMAGVTRQEFTFGTVMLPTRPLACNAGNAGSLKNAGSRNAGWFPVGSTSFVWGVYNDLAVLPHWNHGLC